MLDRNRRIKPSPERFQESEHQFDVIFTVEERIYDAVLEGRAEINYSRTSQYPHLTKSPLLV